MTRRLQSLTFGVVLLLSAVAPAAGSIAAAAGKTKAKASDVTPATVEFWNRPIVVLRSVLAGANPEDRAVRASERLSELPLSARSKDIEIHDIKIEDEEGVGFTYQGKVLFFVGSADLDKESGETLVSVSKSVLEALNGALEARESERQWPVIRRGLLFSFLYLVVLVAFCWAIWKGYHSAFHYLRTKEHSFPVKLRLFGIDLLPHIAGLIYTSLRIAVWLLTLSAIYSWLTLTLGYFPYTQPWGQRLGGYVLQFFQSLGISAVNSLPGIFACIVIFLITRWIVRLGRAFFMQVSNGSIRLSWMDADVAHATERIFTFVAWIFAAVVAYPYIPGSSTDAFKGISVFFGVVVSLGSTGIINQVMSGLFVVYSKALKTGEWVLVNDTEGEVEEVGLLAVKIRTVEQREITIPNSVIVNTSTKNFTRLGHPSGMPITSTVTIGYDAPWRQVQALLLLGAQRTANVRPHPEPYVLQRALSDFYVEYTLIARLQDEKLYVETLSELYANIQDAFNEFGVQIMSPHYVLQPHDNVVVPRSKWHSAPAAPENDETTRSIGEAQRFEAGN